jgi:hypothetical protein
MTRTIIRHAILFAVVLVLMTAIAIWLGLGPVVHSSVS